MLENLKDKVIEISKDAQQSGLCKHKSGNFSIRDEKTGYVVVTPSSVDRMELKTEDICVVNLDGEIIECRDGRKPSSETMMHLEIYKTRNDVRAVAHTHSKFATSFAVLAKRIPAVIYEVASMGLKDGYVPVAKFAVPGTVDLAKSVIEPVKRADLFLLEKHGGVAVGENLDDAYLKVQYLEELAEVYYRSLVINNGKEHPAFTSDQLSVWKYPEKFEI